METFEVLNKSSILAWIAFFPMIGMLAVMFVPKTNMTLIKGITFAATLVPFMCALYLLAGVYVLSVHASEIPAMLLLIVKSAFVPTESAGAFIGGTAGVVDVTPTLLAAAGLELGAPHTGRDLLPVAAGEAPNEPRTYVSELLVFDGQPAPERHLALTYGDTRALLTELATAVGLRRRNT